MTRAVSVAIASAVLLIGSARAQQPRDNAPARPAPAGTASIAGIVDEAVTNGPAAPVRHAIVTIAGSSLPDAASTVTDDGGRFAFEGLPAGRFTLTASKAAFLTQAYGARAPGQPGAGIPLAAGARQSVVMSLTRGAVVTGVVTDDRGKPLAGAVVRVLDAARPDRHVPGNATADDRGVYRIYGLAPGSYLVVAQPRQAGQGEVTARSPDDIDAILARLRQGPGRGATPSRSAAAAAPSVSRPVVLSPVFFPGTPVVDAATAITVRAGEERAGVDFAAGPVPSSAISGVVTDGGAPLGQLQVMLAGTGLRLNATTPDTTGGEPVPGGQPGADGRFSFSNVAPGRYLLSARSRVDLPPDAPRRRQVVTIIGSPNPPAIPGARWRFAETEITVTGGDVSGVALAMGPGAAMSGRLVAEPGSAPIDPRKVSISVSDPASQPIAVIGALAGNRLPPPPAVTPDAEGRFVIPDIAPGEYQLRVSMPAGWQAGTAMVDGRDLLDAPVTLAIGQIVSDVAITATTRHTELAGVLQDPAGFGVADDIVIAIPVDRALWRAGSRRLQVAQPGTDGAFSITALPPGDYFVGALTTLDPQSLDDPAFFEDVAAHGVRVTLRAGERTTQTLRLQR